MIPSAASQVSYAIGVAEPLSVHVDTYGTGTIPDKEILAKVLDKFDFRPGALPQPSLITIVELLTPLCCCRLPRARDGSRHQILLGRCSQ